MEKKAFTSVKWPLMDRKSSKGPVRSKGEMEELNSKAADGDRK